MQQKKHQKYRNRKSETRPKTLNLANIVKFTDRFRFLLNDDAIKALNPMGSPIDEWGKKVYQIQNLLFLDALFLWISGTSLWEKDKVNEPKTWNMEVFIKAVHELQPTLHWKEIIYELDHPGFLIKDRMGLILLINALKLGFKVQGFQVCQWDFLMRKKNLGKISIFLSKVNLFFCHISDALSFTINVLLLLDNCFSTHSTFLLLTKCKQL